MIFILTLNIPPTLKSLTVVAPEFCGTFSKCYGIHSKCYLTTKSRSLFNGQSLMMSNTGNADREFIKVTIRRTLLCKWVFPSFEASILGVGGPCNSEIPLYKNMGTSIIFLWMNKFNPSNNFAGYRVSDNGLIANSAALKKHDQGSKLFDNLTDVTGGKND